MTYEDFLDADSVKHFESGLQAKKGKGKGKNKGVKQAFESKPDMSPERMERLKKMLSESKTGRQTLEFLAEKGSDIVFEPMKYYGYFSPDNNLVALNPAKSDEDLAITFVHEVRHAWQDSQMESTSPEYNPKTFLMCGFAIEADACAAEVMYAHEMRETHPEIWEAHQKTRYAGMSTAFDKKLQETGDVNQARAEALLNWYYLPVKPGYTSDYVDYLSQIGREAADMKEANESVETAERLLSKDIEPQVICDMFFKDYDGKQFLSDPKALEEKSRLQIDNTQAYVLAKGMIPYMKAFDKSAEDLGLDKVTVKYSTGTEMTCGKFVERYKERTDPKNQAASKAALKAFAGRNQGR